MGRYGAEEEGSSEAPLGSFGTAKLGHSVARSWAIAWLCDCLGPGGGGPWRGAGRGGVHLFDGLGGGVGFGVIAHETLHRDVGGCLVSREETRRGLRSTKNYVCYSWLLQPGAVVPLCRL